MTFLDFHFEPELMDGLRSMGFQTPTPIQEKVIPSILDDRDLIACAQTGTGKTAAFLLPILNKLIKEPLDTINALVIVPTRELAIQIDEALQGFSYFTSISAIAIYGGSDRNSFEQEKKALSQGANIIIATPGRLIAHLNMGYVRISNLKHLVLDEADRMLDMGFSEDINKIVSYLPAKKQTLLFSATMPPKIRSMAKRLLVDPVQVNISVSKPAEGVMQAAYFVHASQKVELISQLLQGKNLASILIFSSTKEKVKLLEKTLIKLGFNASAIHSDLEQDQRNEVLRNFKNKKLQILVATDILSRGIDIDSIGLVVNYDVPGEAEDYIHRVGRTARAESTGVALTFVSPEDMGKFKRIESFIGSEIRKIPLPEGIAPVRPGANPERKSAGPNKRFSRDKRRR